MEFAVTDIWPVPEAKARLSELLRRARDGKPQIIGARDPCVVVSAAQFEEMKPKTHLGQWLVRNAPRGEELQLPSRKDSRGDPFADDAA